MSTSPVTTMPSSSGDREPLRERYLRQVAERLEVELRSSRSTAAHWHGEAQRLRALLLALSVSTGQDWIETEGFQNFDSGDIELETSPDLLGQTPIVRWRWWQRR